MPSLAVYGLTLRAAGFTAVPLLFDSTSANESKFLKHAFVSMDLSKTTLDSYVLYTGTSSAVYDHPRRMS